ncbi:MAG: hypothetical protein JNK69_05865 [Saprospiraceae bacterium]|nr:hypothetical protein [Candidatus Vicinibacter proximus]MBL7822913.1 hypothetical protein [Saprospiraceae bacterium]MCC6841578.1 hypothetical protein [Saprospiraceae bacterium]
MTDPENPKSLFRIIIEKCNKVYYSITENFIYLIMAFAAPLFLYYISQGKEVVLYLLDPHEWMNIAMILVSFIVLFYVIWVIPVWSIELLKILSDRNMMTRKMEDKEGGVSPPQLFCILANRYNSEFNHKRVYPIRIFANIPILVFVFTIAGTQWDELFSPFIFLTFLLISLVIKDMVKEFVVEKIMKNNFFLTRPFLGYFGHTAIIIMASLLWACGCYLCGAFVIWLLYFYNDWFHYFIEKISEYWKQDPTGKPCPPGDLQECLYKKSKKVFSVYVIIILLFIIMFWVGERYEFMHKISPVLIMNICFSFIICLIDTAFKTPKDALEVLVVMDQVPDDHSNCLKEIPKSDCLLEKSTDREVKEDPSPQGNIEKGLYLFFSFANIVFLLVSLNLIFIKSINGHRIRKERIGKELYDQLGNRHSLLNYYKVWREKNDNPKTVVLIAGSGGGSRAGYWTGINLDHIYATLGDTAKIFAISTISGSTSGANMFLTRLAADPKSLSVQERKSFWDTIYSRNYLSGGIWGVLLGDGIGGFSKGKTDYDKDRNYYHEQGELSAIQSYFPLNDRDQIRNLMLGDYMSKWTDTTMKFRIPLHFVNSATTQAGKRVLVSPVVVDSTLHPDVVDLYKEFRMNTQNSCNQFSLPMSTAVKISQSFPVVSSYYYLKGVGNLIDGGLYESSGCNTLYEVYTKLRETEEDTSVHFKIIVILNGDSDNCNTEPVNSLFLNTLGSASATPFSGHAVYWQERIRCLRSDSTRTAVEFVELKDSLGNWKEFPLGVMYSQQSLNQIWEHYKGK